jgi:hypothetical protein
MKKLLFIFMMFSLFSCDNETVDETTTPDSQNTAEEDQEQVEASVEMLMNCLEILETGDFSNLLIDIYDNADADTTDFHENMIEAIENIPNYQPLIDLDYPNEPFNIQNYFGTYTYNSQLETWTTEESNSIMKMVFPMFTNSNSNDTSITVSGVTEELLDVEDPIYIPTSLSIEMSHNDQSMLAFNIENVSYTMSGEIPVPNDVNFNIYMNPFTHEFSIDKISDDNFSFGYALSSGEDGCINQIEASIKLLSTDYENLEDTDIDYISGSFTSNSMELEFNIDAEYLFALDDPTTIQINNFVDVNVIEDGVLIGEIELQEDADEDYSLHMIFIDGSSVNVENFIGIGTDGEEFIQTLEGIFARYIDRLDDE